MTDPERRQASTAWLDAPDPSPEAPIRSPISNIAGALLVLAQACATGQNLPLSELQLDDTGAPLDARNLFGPSCPCDGGVLHVRTRR